MENGSGDPAAWYWRIKASEALAGNALAQATAAGPNSPAIHVLLGDAYLHRKMFRQAQAEYEKAVELGPHNVAAHLGVAAALFRLFLLDKALPEVKVVLQLDPQNPQANFMMGDILAYQRKFVQAEPYAKAALHRDPSNLPLVHALLGKIYASQGLTARAIQELRQALPADHDGSLHYQIAMLYKRMGDSPAEREALEESEALRKNYDNGSPKTTQSPRWFARGASGKP
jgi:tetratricopeptide (TPR) repeat protein